MSTRADTAVLIDKARTLVEALPYITRFSGKVVVVKYGGNAMTDPNLARSLARDVVLMHYVGMRPVIVHGGGPQISDLMRRLDQEPTFVDGYRVTGAAELDIVRMVLQKTNKELVAMLNAHGDLAVGVSGEDANLIRALRMTGAGGADLGFVGTVDRVDPKVVEGLLTSGFIPVIAPIGVGSDGQAYNINADHAAAAVAGALRASKLVFLTDVEGLYQDFGDEGSLLPRVTVPALEKMLEGGSLSEGMIPKIRGCVEALRSGVERAHILDGRVEHALLLEIFTDSGVGTMVAW
ncbi:MAG TPA: acetylglutamate kinase [Actinomycetota bacterium]|nr:acetylglutamate kinase [Actinomycetota bacterium]